MTEQTQTAPIESTTPSSAPAAGPAEALGALIEAAKARLESGDLEGGLATFREITEHFPAVPEVFNNLGAVCAAVGRRDEAEQAFTRALLLLPDSLNLLHNRGLVRFHSGDYHGALADFERAYALAPDDTEVANNLGVTLFQLERWSDARRAFEAALAQSPEYLSAMLNLADVDLAEGDTARALERCQALSVRSDDPQVFTKLVECAMRQCQDALDEAARLCETTLEQHPGLEDLRVRLGQIVRARQLLTGAAS
jgi:protein O-GlcNAc transferase